MYAQFETDSKKDNSGVVMYFPANRDGSIPQMTIARDGVTNMAFKAEMKIQHDKHADKIRFKQLTGEDYVQMHREAYAVGIIKGWENVQDRDGRPMEYTRENAVKLLTDLPELFYEIEIFAKNVDNFRRERLEDVAKN